PERAGDGGYRSAHVPIMRALEARGSTHRTIVDLAGRASSRRERPRGRARDVGAAATRRRELATSARFAEIQNPDRRSRRRCADETTYVCDAAKKPRRRNAVGALGGRRSEPNPSRRKIRVRGA